MSKIKGITVKLITKTEGALDDFNNPTITESSVNVSNVLVYPASSTEITNTVNLYGRKAVYQIAIPKGDTHDWENQIVEFYGKRWRVFGLPQKGIEANIPLDWNDKYWCDRYE